jgi:hypothetical protein
MHHLRCPYRGRRAKGLPVDYPAQIMNDPLREIEDTVVRDAIDIFQTYIESAIGNLLAHDRSKAFVQIENARNRAIENVKALGFNVVSMEQEAKTLRLAIGFAQKTFDRLREIYSTSGNGNADAALAAPRNLPLHTAGRLCCQADRQDEGVRKYGHDCLDAISIVTVPSHLVPKKGLRVNESPYYIHDDMRSNLQLLVDRGLSMRGG